MITYRVVAAVFIAIALAASLLSNSAAANGRIDEPVMLVATPELQDELFGSSILIVTPIGNRQHIGFIINRPTPLKLSEMFPDHQPSKRVAQPIYIGGPESVEVLFALVLREGQTGGGIRLTSGLYLEIERGRVDSVIENEPGQARFFVGVVVWQPGELDAEVQNNYWYVQKADADLVLRKSTAGLWEELIKRIRQNKNAITAHNNLFAW